MKIHILNKKIYIYATRLLNLPKKSYAACYAVCLVYNTFHMIGFYTNKKLFVNISVFKSVMMYEGGFPFRIEQLLMF